jgi:hypothetical protein
MISLVVLAFFSNVGLVRYTAELALRNEAFLNARYRLTGSDPSPVCQNRTFGERPRLAQSGR